MKFNEGALIDPIQHIIYLPHLNFSTRYLLNYAAKADPSHRVWKLSYKNVVVGSVRIKNDYPV